MPNPYPASSSHVSNEQLFDDDYVEGLDVLSPGEVPTPIRVGRGGNGRVNTSVSITELPTPAILTKADTQAKREAFRKTEHAMLHHPMINDDSGDRLERIAASMKRSMEASRQRPVYHPPPSEGSPYPPTSEEEGSRLVSNILLGAGVGLLAGVGLYLAYRAVKYMSYAEAAHAASLHKVVPT